MAPSNLGRQAALGGEVSAASGASSYVHSPARSTPNSANAASMTVLEQAPEVLLAR